MEQIEIQKETTDDEASHGAYKRIVQILDSLNPGDKKPILTLLQEYITQALTNYIQQPPIINTVTHLDLQAPETSHPIQWELARFSYDPIDHLMGEIAYKYKQQYANGGVGEILGPNPRGTANLLNTQNSVVYDMVRRDQDTMYQPPFLYPIIERSLELSKEGTKTCQYQAAGFFSNDTLLKPDKGNGRSHMSMYTIFSPRYEKSDTLSQYPIPVFLDAGDEAAKVALLKNNKFPISADIPMMTIAEFRSAVQDKKFPALTIESQQMLAQKVSAFINQHPNLIENSIEHFAKNGKIIEGESIKINCDRPLLIVGVVGDSPMEKALMSAMIMEEILKRYVARLNIGETQKVRISLSTFPSGYNLGANSKNAIQWLDPVFFIRNANEVAILTQDLALKLAQLENSYLKGNSGQAQSFKYYVEDPNILFVD